MAGTSWDNSTFLLAQSIFLCPNYLIPAKGAKEKHWDSDLPQETKTWVDLSKAIIQPFERQWEDIETIKFSLTRANSHNQEKQENLNIERTHSKKVKHLAQQIYLALQSHWT